MLNNVQNTKLYLKIFPQLPSIWLCGKLFGQRFRYEVQGVIEENNGQYVEQGEWCKRGVIF